MALTAQPGPPLTCAPGAPQGGGGEPALTFCPTSTIPTHRAAGSARAAGREGSLTLEGQYSRATCGTNITRWEGLKWSKTPCCAAGVTLTATDTIASPRAEFLLGQWSRAVTPAEPCACVYTGLPVPPPRGPSRPRAPAQLQACGIPSRPQLCQGLVAFGHFISVFGLVIHSAQTAEKRQHQKQSPIVKTQGRANDTEHRDQHLCCSPSAPQMLPTVSRAPFPNNSGEFQREGSSWGAPEAGGSLHHSSSPSPPPRALILPLPYVQVLPPERTRNERRTRTPNTQQASTEPPPEGRASVVRTIWSA